jgi:hypothetical protein
MMSMIVTKWERYLVLLSLLCVYGTIILSEKSYSQVTLDSAMVTPAVVNAADGATVIGDFWLRSPGDSILLLFGYIGHPDSSNSIIGFGTLVQGTKVLGKWEVSFYILPNTASGVYPVYLWGYNSTYDIFTINTGKTVEITGGDTSPPSLSGVPTIYPTSLDLSPGSQLDTVVFTLQDDFSGVAWATARFKDSKVRGNRLFRYHKIRMVH